MTLQAFTLKMVQEIVGAWVHPFRCPIPRESHLPYTRTNSTNVGKTIVNYPPVITTNGQYGYHSQSWSCASPASPAAGLSPLSHGNSDFATHSEIYIVSHIYIYIYIWSLNIKIRTQIPYHHMCKLSKTSCVPGLYQKLMPCRLYPDFFSYDAMGIGWGWFLSSHLFD